MGLQKNRYHTIGNQPLIYTKEQIPYDWESTFGMLRLCLSAAFFAGMYTYECRFFCRHVKSVRSEGNLCPQADIKTKQRRNFVHYSTSGDVKTVLLLHVKFKNVANGIANFPTL